MNWGRRARVVVGVGICSLVGGMAMYACKSPKGSPDDVGGPQYAALESAPMTSAAESFAVRSKHHLKTAFVIVMENHNWNEIVGNRRSAPFINDTLIPSAAVADNYHNHNVEPSEPNYIWMEAGDRLGVFDNDPPDQNYRTTKKHLVSLLVGANVPWKTYQQGIDGKRCPLEPVGDYEPKHNPMIFFSDVTEHNNPKSPNCIAHMRPVTEMPTDLVNNSLAGNYVFITPDRCNNMHDGCAINDPIRNGDNFLAWVVPQIQASAAYKDNGAIFITWDEGSDDGSGPLGVIVLSPLAKRGYKTSTYFTHSSLLRTMQEIFAVGPLLRGAATAASFGELFTAYP